MCLSCKTVQPDSPVDATAMRCCDGRLVEDDKTVDSNINFIIFTYKYLQVNIKITHSYYCHHRPPITRVLYDLHSLRSLYIQ